MGGRSELGTRASPLCEREVNAEKIGKRKKNVIREDGRWARADALSVSRPTQTGIKSGGQMGRSGPKHGQKSK
jgi:hypothetical protein